MSRGASRGMRLALNSGVEPKRWQFAPARLLLALALLMYLGYAALYTAYAVQLFRWPYDYDQGEGFELNDALLFSRGEWPYRDNAVYPYYASNYPPLFHLLAAPLVALWGPHLVIGRVLSFLATWLTAAAIAWLVHREVGGRVIPALSGLAFLVSPYVYQTGPLFRLHTTMVLLELLAIGCLARFEDPRHGRRYLWLGVFLLLLAGYTKQLAVFTVAAGLGFVFLRDSKRALLAGTALAAVAGLLFWLLNRATAGQWWVNIIQANVNAFDYLMTLSLFQQWFRLHPALILLAGGYALYELFWDRLSAYTLWFFFALGTGALSGKWGAGPGYFITAVAASALLAGLAGGRLLQRVSARRRPWLEAGLALLYLSYGITALHLPTDGPVMGRLARWLGVADQPQQLACAAYPYYDRTGYTQLGHWLTAADYQAGAEIMAYVRAAPGPILSEEAMFSLLAGKPVVTNPTQVNNLYYNGLWEGTDLLQRIYDEEFDLIILRAQFYPPPVLGAIWFRYQPVARLCLNGFEYTLLLPPRRLGP